MCPRTLEICRQFDLDVNEIRKLGSNRDDAYWVNFVTSLTGKFVGSLPYERMDAEVLEQTPTVSVFFDALCEISAANMLRYSDDS